MIYHLTHPTAAIARGLDNLMLLSENSSRWAVRTGTALTARVISLTVFPIVLSLEFTFKRLPKALGAISWKKVEEGEISLFSRRWDKVRKFFRSFWFTPLGVISPDGISGFFLKRHPTDLAIHPFGVELQYGTKVDPIKYPKDATEVIHLVQQAGREGKQISIIGAGMSQGTQTIPLDGKPHMIIHTKQLNTVQIDADNNIATVGAGATWEQFQLAANAKGKSAIVKQASDPFSIGGSIGINCHGWAHEAGALSSTVESIDVVMADGKLYTFDKGHPNFKCFFGTMGYFGVVVSAKIRLVDNEHLIEKSHTVAPAEFDRFYKAQIKDKQIPLFGGRLTLDSLSGNPLRSVEMTHYVRDAEANGKQQGPVITPNFKVELKKGYRIERIGLQMLSHFSSWIVQRLISKFWESEKSNLYKNRKITRNEAMHPPINSFNMLRGSNRKAQWLQEYFIEHDKLDTFLTYLGAELKAHDVLLLNATIRPVPQDNLSILPYAEKDRYAVVLCFRQDKSEAAIAKTQRWIENVNRFLVATGGKFYQAYMPYATKEQFEKCYGSDRLTTLREMKGKLDPDHRFGNAHTAKYYDLNKKD